MKKLYSIVTNRVLGGLPLLLAVILLLGSPNLVEASDFRMSQTKITLNLKNVTLEYALSKLLEGTDYGLVFKSNDIKNIKDVSVDIKNQELKEAVKDFTTKYGLTYEISNNSFVISKKATAPVVQQQKSTVLTVKGKIIDEKKTPVAGAVIVVKGTLLGTISDGRGDFSITLTAGSQIEVSFLGFKSHVQTIAKSQDNLVIMLEPEILAVEDVVVTGYQSINRRDMVGASTTLNADAIKIVGMNNISDMLQGQVAGMIVTNKSSRVGTSPKIQIRGTSTLLGNQDPIWVVDGIIQDDPINIDASTSMADDLKTILGNQISWLNPNDIETITVLKDASATAIYGSRASNGVIVITTKKSKFGAERFSVNYSGSLSVNSKPNYSQFNFMNSQERILFAEEAYAWGAMYERTPVTQKYTYEGLMSMFNSKNITKEEFLRARRDLELTNTDWFDLLTRSAVSHSHSISVNGGTAKVNYLASLGYNKSFGQEIGNDNERLTARMSMGMFLHSKVRINVSLDGTIGNTNGFGKNINPLSYATNTSRAIPAFDDNGEKVFYRKNANYINNKNVNDLGYNILNEIENSNSSTKNNRIGINLDFKWDITSWLSYQFTGGGSVSRGNSESYRTEKTFGIAAEYRGYDYGTVDPNTPAYNAAILPFGGDLFTTNTNQNSYNIQNKLLISKTFNQIHRFNAMLATEVRSTGNRADNDIVFGYTPDRGETIQRPTAPDKLVPIGGTGKYNSGLGIYERFYSGEWKKTNKTDNFFSMFATFAYSLKDKYVFNFNVRNDASNRFGQDVNSRLDPTYSLGVSWRVSDESFLKDSKWLTMLNLKGTFGIQGNALTNLSPELIAVQGGVLPVYNQYSASIVSIPNPNLSWEKTKNWNFGAELQLFSKINIIVDYYTRNSNAIITQDLPYEYGMASSNINGGLIDNRGIEATVSFNPVNNKNFGLSVSVNSSKNWSESGDNINFRPTVNNFLNGAEGRLLKAGYPVDAFWSYSFAGLNSADGTPMFNYLDVDKETAKSDPTSYLVYSGQKEPFFTGGLNLGARYKSFSINTSFALLLGGKKRLPSPYTSFGVRMKIPDPEMNLSKDLADRWKKPGDENNTIIPGLVKGIMPNYMLPDGITSSAPVAMWGTSDAMVANASFLRCRNINFSWRVKQQWCQQIGLSSLNVNASVSNLFVIGSKRFNGFDPELGSSVQPKAYSLSINVGF